MSPIIKTVYFRILYSKDQFKKDKRNLYIQYKSLGGWVKYEIFRPYYTPENDLQFFKKYVVESGQ